MKLYHTGLTEIPRPDIFRGRKNADFGQGFYLTPDREFALRWAQKNAVINAYELDTANLRIRELVRNEAWFDYIFHNRRAEDRIDADVIIGPIANDTIYDTFGFISSGFLAPAEATKLLLIGPAYTQVALKSLRAASQLAFLGAEVMTEDKVQDYKEMLRAEQDAYQRDFAAAMREISESGGTVSRGDR